MGIDYYARVVVGVNTSELVRKINVTKEVKKYDQNTGEPYIVKITDSMLEMNGENYNERELINKLDKLGLILFPYQFDGFEVDGTILGMCIASATEYGFEDFSISAKDQDIKEALAELNYRENPRTFVILDAS